VCQARNQNIIEAEIITTRFQGILKKEDIEEEIEEVQQVNTQAAATVTQEVVVDHLHREARNDIDQTVMIEVISQIRAVVRIIDRDKLVTVDGITSAVVVIITIETMIMTERTITDIPEEADHTVESSGYTLVVICGTLTISIKAFLMLPKRTSQRKR
jgi:hypothetical protein